MKNLSGENNLNRNNPEQKRYESNSVLRPNTKGTRKVLIALFFIFLSIFLLFNSYNTFKEMDKMEYEIEETKDTDNDGLTDLEEININTDPSNPDTDGDGYEDGEEVDVGYDPLNKNELDKDRDNIRDLDERRSLLNKYSDKSEDGWIYDVCSNIAIYIDYAGEKKWQISQTACVSPQCDSGVLVADNSVDFSDYPARQACKEIGGRLPSVEELRCLWGNGLLIYGLYWSNTESEPKPGYYDYTKNAYEISSSSTRRFIRDKDWEANFYCVKDID